MNNVSESLLKAGINVYTTFDTSTLIKEILESIPNYKLEEYMSDAKKEVNYFRHKMMDNYRNGKLPICSLPFPYAWDCEGIAVSPHDDHDPIRIARIVEDPSAYFILCLEAASHGLKVKVNPLPEARREIVCGFPFMI